MPRYLGPVRSAVGLALMWVGVAAAIVCELAFTVRDWWRERP